MKPVLLCAVWILGAGLLMHWGGAGLAQPPSDTTADVPSGRLLFRSGDWSATGLTCDHCHADFNEKKDPDNRRIRPGHSLYNSARRPVWHTWDGRELDSLEQAIATCAKRWITARDSLGEGVPPQPPHLQQLMAYLAGEELSPERRSKPIEPLLADGIPSDRMLKAGDAGLGMGVYRRACLFCHLESGSGPAPSLVRNGYSRQQIATKVRGIDNPGLNGLVMPPFSKGRLSDRQLINAVAFVYLM